MHVERLDLGVRRTATNSVEGNIEPTEGQDVCRTLLRWPDADQSPPQCSSTCFAIARIDGGVFAPVVACSSSWFKTSTPHATASL